MISVSLHPLRNILLPEALDVYKRQPWHPWATRQIPVRYSATPSPTHCSRRQQLQPWDWCSTTSSVSYTRLVVLIDEYDKPLLDVMDMAISVQNEYCLLYTSVLYNIVSPGNLPTALVQSGMADCLLYTSRQIPEIHTCIRIYSKLNNFKCHYRQL